MVKEAIKTVGVSMGLLVSAYETFIMGLVIVVLNDLDNPDTSSDADPYSDSATTLLTQGGGGVRNAWIDSFCAVSVLIGTATGQVIFGILGDKCARGYMFLTTCVTLGVFCVVTAFSFPIKSLGLDTASTLGILRFLLGIGIGGEYPLSASIAAENADTTNRGRRMAMIFSVQGLGNLLAPLVFLLLFMTTLPLNYLWRVAIGAGVIPCVIAFIIRLALMRPTPQERMKKSKKLTESVNGDPSQSKSLRKHIPTLIGTAGTWFLFDVTFYGNSLFKDTVVKILGLSGGATRFERLRNTALASLTIASIALPGFLVAIMIIQKVGRKPLQMVGFILTGLTFLAIAIFYHQLVQLGPIFVLLYGLSFFWANMGPNTTTYVISGEAFPNEVRSTCNGISAACGKLGAIVGTSLFKPLSVWAGKGDEAQGYQVTFYICAGIAFFASILTWFLVPETKPKLTDIFPEKKPVGTSKTPDLQPKSFTPNMLPDESTSLLGDVSKRV